MSAVEQKGHKNVTVLYMHHDNAEHPGKCTTRGNNVCRSHSLVHVFTLRVV